MYMLTSHHSSLSAILTLAPENSICEDCYKPWNSENHASDECINLDEDSGILKTLEKLETKAREYEGFKNK